jgi:hypothetical protein
MLNWDQYGFHKKRTWTRYTELVCLHLVESTGHIVYFVTSVARNIDALFFMLSFAWCGFHKKRPRTHYAELVFLHLVGSAGHVVHSGASEPRNVHVLFFILGWAQSSFHKKRGEHVTLNLCFYNQWDLWVMECISVRPWRETSMHYFTCSGGPGAGSIKGTQRHVTLNLCFLHPVGSAGHVVHSGAFGPQGVHTLFFILEWA